MKKELTLTLLISIFALVIGVFLGAQGVYNKTALSSAERGILIDLNAKAYRFNYYNTADFTDFDPIPRHEACGYSDADMKLAEENKIEEPCVEWNKLMNAKEHFRIMSLAARAIAPDEVLTALNNVESGFDEVFDAAIRVDEYNKWPADEYDGIMQNKIGELETAIREAL